MRDPIDREVEGWKKVLAFKVIVSTAKGCRGHCRYPGRRQCMATAVGRAEEEKGKDAVPPKVNLEDESFPLAESHSIVLAHSETVPRQ